MCTPESVITRWPLRGGCGIWKRNGFFGGSGFSMSSMRSICFSLLIACDAFDAT